MAERIKETTVRTGNAVQTTTEIEQDRPPVQDTASRVSNASLTARIIRLFAGIIITILLFRFVLILFGANQGSGFVDFIYTFSYPFAAPFFGMFGYELQYGAARIEISTLVAVAVYGVAAWGLAKLVTIARR